MKLNESTRYYLICIPTGMLIWGMMALLGIHFVNIIFFMMAYVWHFSLLAPNIKEYALKNKNKYSMLATVVKFNYYMQLFIHFDRLSFSSSIVRGISPLIFTLVLFLIGGNGNLIFTILGSLVFELLYLKLIMKIKDRTENPEIPPVIPNEENSHE